MTRLEGAFESGGRGQRRRLRRFALAAGVPIALGCGTSGPPPVSAPRSDAAPAAAVAERPAAPVASSEPSSPPPEASASPPVTEPVSTASASPARKAPTGLARGTEEPADLALREGDLALDAEDLAAAERAYRRAQALAPRDPAARVGLVRVALARSGVVMDYASSPNDARLRALLPKLDQALSLDSKYGPAHVERGRVLLILGRADDALKSLEQGVRFSPRDPEAHSALGVAELGVGKVEQAFERFREASRLDPLDPDRLTNLGTAYLLRGRVDDAIRVFERAVELAPQDARVASDLGTAYLAKNRPDKALPLLERAVRLAPDRATFLSNLGYAYQLSGRPKLAIKTYEAALEKDEKLGSAWINLATALAQQGDYDGAQRALDKARRLDPSDPRVQANLAELKALREAADKAEPPRP